MRVIFIVGEILWLAVNRRRGGIDNAVYVVFAGGLEDGLRTVDIVLGDFDWLLDAGSNAGLGGLVVDDIDVLHDVVDEVGVGGRALDELVAAVVLGYLAGGIDIVLFESGVVERFEDVERGDVVSLCDEGFGEMAANKACTAGDEDTHRWC